MLVDARRNRWWAARAVKAMETEEGKRFWRIAWAGLDEDGEPWPDSWEPTANVSEDLRKQFIEDRKEKVVRTISVDPRPLDTVVQSAIALSVQHGAKETFGRTFSTPIPVLSLHGLAEYYLSRIATQFNVEIKSEKKSPSETEYEVRLLLENAGNFLAFEEHIKSHRATKALVFRGDRKTNVDMLIVPVVMLRYITNKRTEGLVTFEAEHHSCFINGVDGRVQPPHLSVDSDAWLKKDANVRKVVTCRGSYIFVRKVVTFL